MAFIFVDSVAHYTGPLIKWDAQQSLGDQGTLKAPEVVAGSGRGGRACLHFPSRSVGSGQATCCLQKNVSNLATIIVGFAAKVVSGFDSSHTAALFSFRDGNTSQVDLRFDASGQLYFTRNGTTIASYGGFLFNVWHFFEIKVTVNSSTGAAVLKLNGTQVLNFSGNTQATGNAFGNAFEIGHRYTSGSSFTASAETFAMDIYAIDPSTGTPNDFIGDKAIIGLLPTGNGTATDFGLNEDVWTASTALFIGKTIKDSNSNLQTVTAVSGDRQTGGSEPTWNATPGGTTTDNHVTWTNLGSASAYLEVSQNPPEKAATRQASTAYAVGQAIWDTARNVQVCTTAGTTANSNGPTWNATIGGTTSDGSVTWTNFGPLQDTFLSSSTIGDKERFTFPSLSAESITGICVSALCQNTGGGSTSVRLITKSNVTEGDNGSDVPVLGSLAYQQGVILQDPDTAAAWTPSGVNAAEFGIKRV